MNVIEVAIARAIHHSIEHKQYELKGPKDFSDLKILVKVLFFDIAHNLHTVMDYEIYTLKRDEILKIMKIFNDLKFAEEYPYQVLSFLQGEVDFKYLSECQKYGLFFENRLKNRSKHRKLWVENFPKYRFMANPKRQDKIRDSIEEMKKYN